MSNSKVQDYSSGLHAIKKVDKCLKGINEILDIYMVDPDYFDNDISVPIRHEYENAKKYMCAFKKWFRDPESDFV